MLSFNPSKVPSSIPSEYDSFMLIVYINITSELDYKRTSIVPRIIPSVITPIDYKNRAIDVSSLQPKSSPNL